LHRTAACRWPISRQSSSSSSPPATGSMKSRSSSSSRRLYLSAALVSMSLHSRLLLSLPEVGWAAHHTTAPPSLQMPEIGREEEEAAAAAGAEVPYKVGFGGM
jgi:hypothetical protein